MKRSWMIMILGLAVVALLAWGCANKYVTSGKIAFNAKNYDKAINDFTKALEADSTNAEAHYYLGRAYLEKRNYTAMRQHFDKAVAYNPKYQAEIEESSMRVWGELFNSGNQKAKDEKWQEALADFQTAIAVIPTKYEAYTNAGYVWQHLDNDDSAYVYYEKAVSLDPTNIKVLSNLASLTFNMGRYDESDSLFARVLEAEPNNDEALLRRGEIADQKGNYEEAVKFYSRSLDLNPDQCDVLFNLGVIYFQKLKNLENAEQAFSKAVDKCPDDINAMINLNVVLISLNKFDEAVTRLTTFTEQNPGECAGWDLLSQALLRKGDKDKAYEVNKKFKDCEAGVK